MRLNIEPLTPEWHERRRWAITASEVAALMGKSPYKTALDVWARVTGKLDPDEIEGTWLERGQYLEPAVAQWYAHRTGRELEPCPGLLQDDEFDWFLATPDYGLRNPERSEPGALECKAPGSHKAKEWEWDVQEHFQIQLQAQLRVWGRSWGTIVAALDDIVYRDFERHDAFQERMMAFLLDWRDRYWIKDEPPPATRLDFKVLNRLHPEDNGEIVTLPPEFVELADLEAEATTSLKDAEERREELRVRIKEHMGENTYAMVRPGEFFSWKRNSLGQRVFRRTTTAR